MNDELRRKMRRLCEWATRRLGATEVVNKFHQGPGNLAREILAELDAEEGLGVVPMTSATAAVLADVGRHHHVASGSSESELPASEGSFEITLGVDKESATVDGEPVSLDGLWAKLVASGEIDVPIAPPSSLVMEAAYPGGAFYRMVTGVPEGVNWTQFFSLILQNLENHRAQRRRDLDAEEPHDQ